MPVRFLTPNPADSATLTPSSEKTGFVAENVQDVRLTKRWVTGVSVTTEFVEFDFGAAQAVTAAVIDGHDITTGDSNIKLFHSDDGAAWTEAAEFTHSVDAMVVFISSLSHRYWKVEFDKSASGEERSVGRVFIGTYVQPTRGYQLGWRRTLSDMSQTKRAFSGTQYGDTRNLFWEVDLKLSHEPTATFDTLRDELSVLGVGDPLWMALEPTTDPNGPLTLYGRFSKEWKETEPLNDFFNWSGKFAEDL